VAATGGNYMKITRSMVRAWVVQPMESSLVATLSGLCALFAAAMLVTAEHERRLNRSSPSACRPASPLEQAVVAGPTRATAPHSTLAPANESECAGYHALHRARSRGRIREQSPFVVRHRLFGGADGRLAQRAGPEGGVSSRSC
jgi:hypothetical protein